MFYHTILQINWIKCVFLKIRIALFPCNLIFLLQLIFVSLDQMYHTEEEWRYLSNINMVRCATMGLITTRLRSCVGPWDIFLESRHLAQVLGEASLKVIQFVKVQQLTLQLSFMAKVCTVTSVNINGPAFSPPAYVVCGKVMFSHMFVCQSVKLWWGGGGPM